MLKKAQKRAFLFLMLTVFLISIFITALNIQPVAASETIVDTEVGESRFTTSPARVSPYYWVHVQNHDTFYTRAYNNNFWYTLCGADGTGEPLYYGTWQASLPTSGNYEVFAWIPNPDAFVYDGRTYTPTQYAVYQIYHQSGLSTKVVNQRLRTGNWYSMGTFTFASSATIILNDRTGEAYASTMIAFDAIKFVYIPPPPTFDFTLGISPSSGSVQQGGSKSATVTVTLTSGSTQAVTLTASGLPLYAYPTFSPSSGNPTFSSTFTISTSTTTPTGTFYITITGSGGGLTRTTTYALTVTPLPVPDFSISASPTSLSVQQGSSGSSTITITSINGFNQPVQLSKSGVPSGVTATLSPSQVTPPGGGTATSSLTVSVGATATPGSYTLTVTGTSGALSHNVHISLGITAAPPPEWTFAVITDLHIGRGYEEGTATGHVSNYNGQDYYITDRLQKVVTWIRDNAAAYSIKFVVITGDITEDGTQVEMHRANEILAGLGDIPYFPVVGNHDVNNGETSNFENEFNDAFFAAQCAKLDVTWENRRTNEAGAHLQNYAFRYKEKNFVFLDCVDRGFPYAPAKLYASTLNVLREFLNEGKPTILFSHHPMIQSYEVAFSSTEMDDIASAILTAKSSFGTKTLANFAGHIHGYFDQTKWFFGEHSFMTKKDAIQWYNGIGEFISTPTFFNANGDYRDEGYPTPGNIPVITTEAMMVGSNEPAEKGVIRLATVAGDDITWSEKGVFQSLNPHIICAVTSGVFLTGNNVHFQVYAFTKLFNTGRAVEYRLYIDGQLDDRIKYSSAVELKDFNVFLKRNVPHEVNLVVIGYAPDGSQIVENIKRSVIVGKLAVLLKCPADIALIDPIGRSISAESNEIPNATYTEADPDRDGNIDKFIEILSPIEGNYVIKLNGTDSGLYSMSAQFATSEEVLSFNATEIPVSLGASHVFTIDWAALSQDEEGITVNVDSNGDGAFDYTFTSDSELTRNEFLIQTGQSALYTFSIVWGAETFALSVESNSTVSNFAFSQPNKQIGFNVTDEAGTIGFCNVTIPKALLYGEPWTVLIDGISVPPTITENETHSSLYFTYTHSTHTIQVIGTWVIGPPPDTIPPLIGTPSQEPEPDKVTPDKAVRVSVGVTDMESGVKNVILSYTANGGATWSNLTMLYNATIGLYQATIPAFLSGTNICYKIIAYDNADNIAINDNTGQYYCYTVNPPTPPPLSVSVSPLSDSILVGQSVTFTSTISGGCTPYSYQWYLNGNPVSGETSASWTFAPTSSGIYYIYLKVTDDKGNTAQSDAARITATTMPVGGYSFPIQVQTNTDPTIPYIALITALTAISTKLRPKTKRKH